MKLHGYIVAILTGVFIWSNANACAPLPPKTLKQLQAQKAEMWLSKDKRYLFKVIPRKWAKEKGELVVKRSDYTMAFELLRDGQLRNIWSMKGTFRNGYVSSDGLTMLVFHNVYSQDARAVTIYKSGKVIRSYKSIDFGVTSDELQRVPCSGRRWLKQRGTWGNQVIQRGDSLLLTTVDDEEHVIDLLRGEKAD